MKLTCENELRSLQSWINNVNNGLASGMTAVINLASTNKACYLINAVANGIEGEYPYYATELKNISANLFGARFTPVLLEFCKGLFVMGIMILQQKKRSKRRRVD